MYTCTASSPGHHQGLFCRVSSASEGGSGVHCQCQVGPWSTHWVTGDSKIEDWCRIYCVKFSLLLLALPVWKSMDVWALIFSPHLPSLTISSTSGTSPSASKVHVTCVSVYIAVSITPPGCGLIPRPSDYRIAGNFQGRKLLWTSEKYDFCGENFHGTHGKSLVSNVDTLWHWASTKGGVHAS